MRPGEPKAGPVVTSYGPVSASGAPSRGNALAIISGVMPGGCAEQTPASESSAAAADRNYGCLVHDAVTPSGLSDEHRHLGVSRRKVAGAGPRSAVNGAAGCPGGRHQHSPLELRDAYSSGLLCGASDGVPRLEREADADARAPADRVEEHRVRRVRVTARRDRRVFVEQIVYGPEKLERLPSDSGRMSYDPDQFR